MISCSCGFETTSVRTLRNHYAANHGDRQSFFENFKDVIVDNWDTFPPKSIRSFMLWMSGYKCSSCGYSKTRECGTTILEIDHIDGNHENNKLANLQVLCPNCHALTPKYRNWSNKGNKKNTKTLRPGNLGYENRFVDIEAREDERKRIRNERENEMIRAKETRLLLTQQKRSLKEVQAEVCSEFEKMKAKFQQDFVSRVLALHESGEINFSKYGWVQALSDRLNEKPQVVGRRVRSLLPDFYLKHCYNRTYNHYVNWNMEWIRPDEEAVLKTAAGLEPVVGASPTCSAKLPV